MWPAFWMNPNQVQWPLGGEIDILENRGSQPTLTSSAFHWQKNPGPCCGQHQYVFEEYTATSGGQPVNFHTGFHTYAAEWDKHPTTNRESDSVLRRRQFALHGDAEQPDVGRQFHDREEHHLESRGRRRFRRRSERHNRVSADDARGLRAGLAAADAGVAGDYNADGQVDAADYVIWRKTEGQSGIGLRADGSGNGSVGQEDYNLWRQNYAGAAGLAAAAAAAAAGVPEPTTAVPMAFSLLLLYSQRVRY